MKFIEINEKFTENSEKADEINRVLLKYKGLPIYIEYGECYNAYAEAKENERAGYGVCTSVGEYGIDIAFFPDGVPCILGIHKAYIKRIQYKEQEVYYNELFDMTAEK